ncbi:hypothetical protein GEMRC1_006237 [Eukaryota sp. GEM-RC1]
MLDFCVQFFDDVPSTNPVQIMNAFQADNLEEKIGAMKSLLHLAQHHSTETVQLIMPWIRYILPNSDKILKRLSYLFLESILHEPSFDANSTLVCNHLHGDLLHENEFVRGVALRLASRIDRPELLPSLIPAILENLSYRQPYVRRIAVTAIHSIARRFPDLIDIPSTLLPALEEENDPSVVRNSFACIAELSPSHAHELVSSRLDELTQVDPAIQLVFIRIINGLLKSTRDTSSRSEWLRVLAGFLESQDPAVLLECSDSLLSASGSINVVNKALDCYSFVLSSSRLGASIVLSRLEILSRHRPSSIKRVITDLVSLISCRDYSIPVGIREKALKLVAANLTGVEFSSITKVLQNNITGIKPDKGGEMVVKFVIDLLELLFYSAPESNNQILKILIDLFLTLSTSPMTSTILNLVKTLVIKSPDSFDEISSSFLSVLPTIKSTKSLRVVLWLFGELSPKRSCLDVANVILECINDSSSELYSMAFNTQSFISTVLALTLVKLLNKGKEFENSEKFENIRLLIAEFVTTQLKLRSHQRNIYTSRLLDCMTCVFDLDLIDDKIGDTWKGALLIGEDQQSKMIVKEFGGQRDFYELPSFSSLYNLSSMPIPVTELVAQNSPLTGQNDGDKLAIFDLVGVDSPVIVEGYLVTRSFMIHLDLLVKNKSDRNFSNVLVNVEATGDLKVTHRPPPFSLGAGKTKLLSLVFTVGSLETCAIFGHVELGEGLFIPLLDLRLDVVSF